MTARRAKWALPLLVGALGAAGVAALVGLRPRVEADAPAEVAPLVQVVEARRRDHRYVVRAHGTVEPRTESELVPQVSGEVVWVSPSFVSGGFFAKGEPLVRIDEADYRVELESARAAFERATSEFDRAETERDRQRRLGERGVASQARIDDAENRFRVARAELREARARLERAERDLARTELRAPFEGRVRSESVDVGQFVGRGQAVATLYAVDWAEVPLPVPDRALRYVDVPLRMAPGGGVADDRERSPVRLRAEFAGEPRSWTGRVVRTQGAIDPQTRMVTLVARVEDPYGLHAEDGGAPLAVGLFVEAEIQGRRAEEVFVLPREALREREPHADGPAETVHVVDAEGRLRVRPVEVLRTEREQVVIGEGLEEGERVSLSVLRGAVDGMRVRVAGEDAASPEGAEAAAKTEAERKEAPAPESRS